MCVNAFSVDDKLNPHNIFSPCLVVFSLSSAQMHYTTSAIIASSCNCITIHLSLHVSFLKVSLEIVM